MLKPFRALYLVFVAGLIPRAKKWRQRRLWGLLEGLTCEDVIIFAEVVRMARSTIEALETLGLCMEKKLTFI